MLRGFLAAAVIAAVAGSGCNDEAARERARQETIFLASDVETFREGIREGWGPGKRQELAASVARSECTEADVCAAKAACVDAIQQTLRALNVKDDNSIATAGLRYGWLSPDAAGARALPGKQDEEDTLLEAAQINFALCDKRLVELRQHYGG